MVGEAPAHARGDGTGRRPRLGFFGGSFDPPHRGHLELARRVVVGAGLERLFFVPAARNPHKATGPRAPSELRLAMLEAAVAGESSLGVLDWELRRPPPSRTLETVRFLQAANPAAELCWVIGADQLPGLPRWWRIEELVAAVTFLVVARPGAEDGLPRLEGLRVERVEAPRFDLSSTVVRERLGAGLPVDNCVPLPVLEILRQHPELYSSKPRHS